MKGDKLMIVKLNKISNLIIDREGIIKIHTDYTNDINKYYNLEIGKIQMSGDIISAYEQHQIRKLLLDKKQNIKFAVGKSEQYYTEFLKYWKKDIDERLIAVKNLIFDYAATIKEALFGLAFLLKDEFYCLSFNEIEKYIKIFKESIIYMSVNDTVDFGAEIFNKSLEYLFPVNINLEQKTLLLNEK